MYIICIIFSPFVVSVSNSFSNFFICNRNNYFVNFFAVSFFNSFSSIILFLLIIDLVPKPIS